MDNLLKLNDSDIIDTHLLLCSENDLRTEVNNCIFFSMFRHVLMKLKVLTYVHNVHVCIYL
jgi:hypothetical protein